MSLFYVGGMYLNDYFDRAIDARERPGPPDPERRHRPRPRSSPSVSACWARASCCSPSSRRTAALAGGVLAGAIVLYDAWHKGNPIGPLVMGLCRMLVYAVAGFAATATPDTALYRGGLALLAYLVGLTYVAKQEGFGAVRNLWPLAFLFLPFAYAVPALAAGALPLLLFVALAAWVAYALGFVRGGARRSVPRATVSLIAGIALLDALLIAWAGASGLALTAVACFALTVAGQRWISGT